MSGLCVVALFGPFPGGSKSLAWGAPVRCFSDLIGSNMPETLAPWSMDKDNMRAESFPNSRQGSKHAPRKV